MTAETAWDPDRYRRYAGHRYRPGLDLIARIPPPPPPADRAIDRDRSRLRHRGADRGAGRAVSRPLG